MLDEPLRIMIICQQLLKLILTYTKGLNKVTSVQKEQLNRFQDILLQMLLEADYKCRCCQKVYRCYIFYEFNFSTSTMGPKFNLKKLQNFDARYLPSCKSKLLQQFLRASYISSIWNNPYLKCNSVYQLENNGWVKKDNTYHFKNFYGNQLSNYVIESLHIQNYFT